MSVCSVDGCGGKVKAHGLCGKHYQRQRLHGTPENRKGCKSESDSCSVDGCGGKIEALGFCQKHYKRFKSRGTIDAGKWTQAPVEERFWRFVSKTDGCWEWIGKSLSSKGYGTISTGGSGSKKLLAHRLSYEIHHGPIPDGLVVMHSCDNPACVNPEHLSVGTQSQNIKDMFARGRQPIVPPHKFGEDHKRSKLSEASVIEIIQSTDKHKVLADRYGVASNTIKCIKRGLTWKHIPR